MAEKEPRVEAAIAYARHLAAMAIDPSSWGFLEQGTTLTEVESNIARIKLARLQEEIRATIDQRMVEVANGIDRPPA